MRATFVALLVGGVLSGCVVAEPPPVVTTPPPSPPAQVEVAPPTPGPGYVWVPGHCYPEFYLEDAEGRGHWIPCQAAGTRAFGSMPEHRPILQKGDNFRVP